MYNSFIFTLKRKFAVTLKKDVPELDNRLLEYYKYCDKRSVSLGLKRSYHNLAYICDDVRFVGVFHRKDKLLKDISGLYGIPPSSLNIANLKICIRLI